MFYDILKNLRQTKADGSEVGNDVAILSKNFQSAKDQYVLDIITMRGSQRIPILSVTFDKADQALISQKLYQQLQFVQQ